MLSFAQRLAAAVQLKQTPVVVGLDPRWQSLPESLRQPSALHGENEPVQQAAAFAEFCRRVIDVVAPLVPAVKPQVAFFEQLGPPGLMSLAQVIAHARKRELLVIVDAKRSDIGSTAAAYASAYFGPSAPWPADALTVSPYLGEDSLMPFVSAAREQGGGLFVLVKTSNPGGGQFQDLLCDGQPVYRQVAEFVEQQSAAEIASPSRQASDAASNGRQKSPASYGSVGAVVGATYPEQLAELRAAMPHAWLLIPGYGSQGGTAKDVVAGFDADGLGAIVNNSRGIIFAHQRREYAGFGPSRWQEAVEAATREMIAQLRSETPAGRLGQGV
ncbi:MAG TPA: orotidine-5'-phosphate decarboxylase [Pirellulales bacterium]|nr:orotidine-5'-phosphate decarboxylase [Pirellulales bacterium]